MIVEFVAIFNCKELFFFIAFYTLLYCLLNIHTQTLLNSSPYLSLTTNLRNTHHRVKGAKIQSKY